MAFEIHSGIRISRTIAHVLYCSPKNRSDKGLSREISQKKEYILSVWYSDFFSFLSFFLSSFLLFLSFFLFFNIRIFKTSLLEYNCFTMVCQFLLYNKVNQLYTYIYPHILPLRLPPTLPIHPSRWTQSTELISLCYVAASHQLSILHLVVYIWYSDF